MDSKRQIDRPLRRITHQRGSFDAERIGELTQHQEGGIAGAALQLRQIALGNPGRLGERLARHAPAGARQPHALADIEAHARCGAGGLSLKLIKLGGYSAALEAAGLCQRLGLKVNVAAKIAESSIASAAAVHLACAVPSADWGVSLTHFYLAEDLVKAPLPLTDGTVALPTGPGLGIDIDEAAVERLRVA